MNIDDPIQKFGGFSIQELVENGNIVEAETWLKQTEYNIHRIVKNQFGEVEVTADFNTVRKELGLPISVFVTGGKNRQSYIKSIDLERDAKEIVSRSKERRVGKTRG